MSDGDSTERVGPLNFMADMNKSDKEIMRHFMWAMNEVAKAQLEIVQEEAEPSASEYGKALVQTLFDVGKSMQTAIDNLPEWVRKIFGEFLEHQGGDTEES